MSNKKMEPFHILGLILSNFVALFLGHELRKLLQNKHQARNEFLLYLGTLFIFIVVLVFVQEEPEFILANILAFAAILELLTRCSLLRSYAEDNVLLSSEGTASSVLATMYFNGFLQRAIMGLDNCDELISEYKDNPTLLSMLELYKNREKINVNDKGDWVCPKVFVLFPAMSYDPRQPHRIPGSIQDLEKRARLNGEKFRKIPFFVHGLEIEYKNQEGQFRKVNLYVFKFREQTVEGHRNIYITVAENRPLNTLYALHHKSKTGPFNEAEFAIHYNSYMSSLRSLLDADINCRGKYHILPYRESEEANITELFLSAALEIRKSQL